MGKVTEEEFFDLFQAEFAKQMGQMGYQVEVREVNPSNHIGSVKGLILQAEEDPNIISPIIYPDQYLDQYEKGYAIEGIIADIRGKIMLTLNGEEMQSIKDSVANVSAEEAKTHVRSVLVNYERNKEKLKEIPHERIEDLALYAEWMIDDTKGMVVNNKLAEKIGLPIDELMFLAKGNTAKLYSFQSMLEQLMELMGMDSDSSDLAQMEDPMCVLTTTDGIHGAALMGDNLILDRVHKKLKENFYILPSSVYEVLILPVSASNATIQDLKQMVKQVNDEQVAIPDQLSDNVYFYNGKELTIAG